MDILMAVLLGIVYSGVVASVFYDAWQYLRM